jgi:hypothetical protein
VGSPHAGRVRLFRLRLAAQPVSPSCLSRHSPYGTTAETSGVWPRRFSLLVCRSFSRSLSSRRRPSAPRLWRVAPVPPSGGSPCSESESGRALRGRRRRRNSRSQTGAETASGLRTGLLCALAVAFQSLDGLGREPSKPGKAVDVQFIDPARLHAYDVQPCPHAPANRQATRKSGKPAGLLYGATNKTQRRPPPLSKCRFFAPSVRFCLSCMPVNPDASTHTIRVSLRLRQCAAIAVCRLPPSKIRASSAEPQSPLRMHWRSPRRGTLRQTRLVFAAHPSPPKTASPGSGQGCPALRPVSRFSPVAAENVTPKVSPTERRLQERVALRRHPGGRTVAAEFARRPRPS